MKNNHMKKEKEREGRREEGEKYIYAVEWISGLKIGVS